MSRLSGRGPRELARDAIRSHVIDVALGLFVESGYDETSIEEICRAAGVSRSSFFRYFASKSDLLEGNVTRFGERVTAALVERPAAEPLWHALRRALDPLVDAYAAYPGARSLAKLVSTTPSLSHSGIAKAQQWQRVIGPEIARRIDATDDPDDPRVAAIVAAMVGAIEAAMAVWARQGESISLGMLLDEAMSPFGAPPLAPHTSATRG